MTHQSGMGGRRPETELKALRRAIAHFQPAFVPCLRVVLASRGLRPHERIEVPGGDLVKLRVSGAGERARQTTASARSFSQPSAPQRV